MYFASFDILALHAKGSHTFLMVVIETRCVTSMSLSGAWVVLIRY